MLQPPQARRRHAVTRSLVQLLVLCMVATTIAAAEDSSSSSSSSSNNSVRLLTKLDLMKEDHHRSSSDARQLAPKKGSTYYSYDTSAYYSKASKKKSKKSKIGYYDYNYEYAVATVEDEEDEDAELRLEFSYDELQDSEEDDDVSMDASSDIEKEKDSIVAIAAYYTSKKKSKKYYTSKKKSKKSSKNNYYSYYYYSSKKKEEKKSEKSYHKSEKNSSHKSEKKSSHKSATKSEQSHKSQKSEKKSEAVPNKRPTRKPTSTSHDPAMCSANPVCQGLGLKGDCCPNGSVLLDCCAQCVAAPHCAAQGLQDGACCPTEDGVYLDCCTNTPYKDEKVFVPKERWTRTLDDALPDDTGFLVYDPVTKYAWYAYNAARHPTNVESKMVGTNVALGRSSVLTTKTNRVATIGRICPLDTSRQGKILESLCLKIVPETAPYSAAAPTAISSTIQAVEACYGSVKKGAPLMKLAVIVRDDASNQQDTPYGALVGSRLLVYNMILAGSDNQNDKNQPTSSLELAVEYEGWASVYGAPLLHGRPTFSANCHTVYTTWLTEPRQANKPQTTTIATNILQGGFQNSGELWRLGTGSRVVGLATSSDTDEEVLFGATNVHHPETQRTGGSVVQLNATTGQVLQDYTFADEDSRREHNAYTNVVVDPNTQTLYYIDSGYGLVQFKGTQLSAGPRWTALQSTNQQKKPSSTLEIARSRKRSSSSSSSSSNPPLNQKEERVLRPKQDPDLHYNDLFTAYQPAVDPVTSMVYGCSGNAYNSHLGGEDQGIVAVDTQSGRTIWYTPMPPTVVYTAVVGSPAPNAGTTKVVHNLGACGGITADLQIGSSWAADAGASSATEHPNDEHTGLYLARYSRIECFDSTDGTLLWTYNAAASTKDTDRNTLSKFVVVAGDTVLVANGGTVVSLQTTQEPVVTPIVAPTAVPAAPTTKPQPTTKPNYSPGAVPTSPPTESGASSHTVVRSAAILSAMTLSLVLMLL